MEWKQRLVEFVILGCAVLNVGCNDTVTGTIPRSPTYHHTLDHVLADSSTLSQLYLSNIGDSLDPRIGAFRKLITLDIRNSDIEYLPNEFAKLRKLYILTLENNKFKSIPKQIFELSTLSFLSMPGNDIDSIAFGLQRLRQLEHLDLQENNLRQITMEHIYPSKMHTLDFSGNKLLDFPADSNDFPALQYLYLDANPIPDSTRSAIRRRLPRVEITF